MVFRIALACAATGAAVSAPETTHYRIESHRESRVDLSAFGQGEQVQTETTVWFVTIAYRDSAGGLAMHAVVDSVQSDGQRPQVAPAELAAVRGMEVRAFLDGRGKTQSISRTGTAALGAEFEGAMRGFHPVMPAGAAPGQSWVDTLDVAVKTDDASTSSRSVRTYTRGPDESRDGGPAIRLEMSARETSSGSMTTPGGPAEMAGTTSATGVYYLSPARRYLGGRWTATGDVSVSGSFAPNPIPVRTSATTTITVIR